MLISFLLKSRTSVSNNNNNIFQQIRTATKRASGSKTSMKDSAGRRLGPKKVDGQLVKPGEIIMRQRGTKFYPGENVGIGKDHTIFATEPGYVKFYMDPFHPERKFIGVALKKELSLPTPHFAPRVRRFGHAVITDEAQALKEEQSLSRKEFLAKDIILKELKERELKRDNLRKTFAKRITNDKILTEPKLLPLATEYLLFLRTSLKNGFDLKKAQYNTFYHFQFKSKLNGELRIVEDDLLTVSNNLNKNYTFNNKLELIRAISGEERLKAKNELIDELNKLQPITSKENKKKCIKLFEKACDLMSLSEEVHLRRKFLKPVQPETVGVVSEASKKTVTIRRYNYEKRKVDTIIRSKEAFLSKI
ncbi:related to 54S ribosomal protein L2, mitochondrial [Saccharomycodes ludwigii]|uniref:Large ribosomal subunit protein bL27m n=1 Tax=Saccharomycodes ludwigii TaxID=36035 RepID=A0A376B0U1_9ASCO|nr:hypothetical protein SCDLUD_003455 [Saccharomycodes ludwigii]KAH3900470.1 hypothetical protein SCDLUD_003455 [Saccharomycodes ludwigii]SSD58251.1 related to 54S ribosomal protein L2, mitochondrial [Saccharomycodes ludwigii]